MYLYKTSALNEIRRRLSARLSAELSNRFSSTTTTSTTSNPNALHADHSTHVNHSVSDSCKGSSKEVAEESSQQATASCSDAYVNEMSINWPGGDVPLMQTKYCLRYELGLCPKSCSNNHLNNGYLSDNKAVAPTPTPTPTSLPASSRLYLLNGRNRLALAFDCQKCCMLVNPDPTVRKM